MVVFSWYSFIAKCGRIRGMRYLALSLIFSLLSSCSLLSSKKTSRNPQSVDSEDIVAFGMQKKDARRVIDYVRERFTFRPSESPTLRDWEEAILIKEVPVVLITRKDFEADMEKNLFSFEVASYNLGASKAFVIEGREMTKAEKMGKTTGLTGVGAVSAGAGLEMAELSIRSTKWGRRFPRLVKSGIPVLMGGFALAIGGLLWHTAAEERRPWMVIVDQDASDYYRELAGELLRGQGGER